MKTKPTLLKLLLPALLLLIIAGCKKETNDNQTTEDWATPLAGVYTNTQPVGGTNYNLVTYFTVTKAENKTIVIRVNRDASGTIAYSLHSCFDSVTLNTSNSFIINESDNCDTADYWAVHGTGSFTPNSLTINWTTERDAPAPYNSYNYSMIATK